MPLTHTIINKLTPSEKCTLAALTSIAMAMAFNCG